MTLSAELSTRYTNNNPNHQQVEYRIYGPRTTQVTWFHATSDRFELVAANVSQVNIGAAGLRCLLAPSCPNLKTLILVKTGRVNDHCLKVCSFCSEHEGGGGFVLYCGIILSACLLVAKVLWLSVCTCAVSVNGTLPEELPTSPHVHGATDDRAWFAAVDVPYSGPVPSHTFNRQARARDMQRAYQPHRLHPTWPHRPARGQWA